MVGTGEEELFQQPKQDSIGSECIVSNVLELLLAKIGCHGLVSFFLIDTFGADLVLLIFFEIFSSERQLNNFVNPRRQRVLEKVSDLVLRRNSWLWDSLSVMQTDYSKLVDDVSTRRDHSLLIGLTEVSGSETIAQRNANLERLYCNCKRKL